MSLTCCVCGEDAGRYRQHWNRDDGYGVCLECVGELWARGMSDAEIENLYGKCGVHYGLRYQMGGRIYNVTVLYRSKNVEAANAWMAAHPDDALLAEQHGFLIIASKHDLGALPTPEGA